MRILITSGGTQEPIDGIRVITNLSTGSTGAGLADYLSKSHDVTALHAATAARPQSDRVQLRSFVSYDDLERELKNLLGSESFDLVLHLAAVGDFRLSQIQVEGQPARSVNTASKVTSSRPIQLFLEPRPKLLVKLKMFSKNEAIKVVGFKLTRNAAIPDRQAAVVKLFAEAASTKASSVDAVVHNDWSEINGSRHVARLYRPSGLCWETATKQELAEKLERTFCA